MHVYTEQRREKMKIKPIKNRVLVEPIKEEKSKSGIILPDTTDDKKQTETQKEPDSGLFWSIIKSWLK